jgi:hypothetical protein
MKKLYKTALGKSVDIDQLRLTNEDVIAVGNMKVNARGDELGPGGEVVRTRNEIMNDYYKLHTPTVSTTVPDTLTEVELYPDPQEPASAGGTLRGSLADSIAKSGIR